MACIVLNTLVLAADHYAIDQTLYDVLEVLNLVFTVLFGLEMFVKLMAVGPKRFFHKISYVLDSLILCVAIVEFGVGNSASLSAIRSFRLLRAFKMIAHRPQLKALLAAVLLCAEDLVYFSLLMLLFVFVYAILGLQLFKG